MQQKYLKYSVEELAMDQPFIDWCKGKSPAEDPQWDEWLSQHPAMKDKVEEAASLIDSVQVEPVAVGDRKAALWDRIDQTIESMDPAPKIEVRERKMKIWWAAAAVLLVLVAVRFLLPADDLIETNNSQQLAYVLPDGSIAHLNDGSSIRLRTNRFNENRHLQLKGEAFFEVEKGSTFLVETPNGSVEVLGTSFNVYARGDALEVHCNTGRVKVMTQQDTTILTAGKHVVRNTRGGLIEGEFNVSSEGDWTDGKFEFKNKPLSRVFSELERQYDVEVKLAEGLGDELYTGFFNDHNLDSALYNICWPLQLNYEIQDKEIIIQNQ